jgi:hypothetical protein
MTSLTTPGSQQLGHYTHGKQRLQINRLSGALTLPTSHRRLATGLSLSLRLRVGRWKGFEVTETQAQEQTQTSSSNRQEAPGERLKPDSGHRIESDGRHNQEQPQTSAQLAAVPIRRIPDSGLIQSASDAEAIQPIRRHSAQDEWHAQSYQCDPENNEQQQEYCHWAQELIPFTGCSSAAFANERLKTAATDCNRVKRSLGRGITSQWVSTQRIPTIGANAQANIAERKLNKSAPSNRTISAKGLLTIAILTLLARDQ